MKNILTTLIILSGIFAFYSFVNVENKQADKNECEFIEKSLEEIKMIKIRMKREDLNKIFRPDGGISGITEQRFVYEKCQFIKVDVKFSPIDKSNKLSANNPEDKIIEISKPYLERPFID